MTERADEQTVYAPGTKIPMRPLPSNIGWPGLIAAIIGVAFGILNPFIGVFWLTIVLVVLITNRKSAASSPGVFRLALGLTFLGLLACFAIILGLISVTTESTEPDEPQPAAAAVIGQES